MNKYTVTASRSVVAPEFANVAEPDFSHCVGQTETITVMARAYSQNIWSKATLVGVSAAGRRKLDRFFAEHGSAWEIVVDATKYMPRLVGYNA